MHLSFKTVCNRLSRGHIPVFFNRHCSIIKACEREARRSGLSGPQEMAFKLIKHFADTTRVSPYLAGPEGCCPLNFLNLINLKFPVSAPNGCCILYFRLNQSFVRSFLSTRRCKSQVPLKETKCVVALEEISETC